MSDSIKIRVVSVNGRLIGQSASDRWNLMSLGMSLLGSDDTSVRRAVAVARAMGFRLVGTRRLFADVTTTEWDALGSVGCSALLLAMSKAVSARVLRRNVA